jgi:hypothetical protein
MTQIEALNRLVPNSTQAARDLWKTCLKGMSYPRIAKILKLIENMDNPNPGAVTRIISDFKGGIFREEREIWKT